MWTRSPRGRVSIGVFLVVVASLVIRPVRSTSAQEPKADSPESLTVLERLEEKLNLQFPNETPLEDVLKFVKTASSGPGPRSEGIPYAFDEAGMKRAGKTRTSSVTIESKDEPLKTSLKRMLKPLGLTYHVKLGVLVVTSEPVKGQKTP